MTDEELKAIEERVNATTAAPWCTGSIPWQVWFDGGYGKVCRIESKAEDRDFIANARQDVPALLEEVRRLNRLKDVLLDTVRDSLAALNTISSDSPSGPLAMNLAGILMRGLNNAGAGPDSATSLKRKCPRGHAMLNDGGPCYICGAGDADHP